MLRDAHLIYVEPDERAFINLPCLFVEEIKSALAIVKEIILFGGQITCMLHLKLLYQNICDVHDR